MRSYGRVYLFAVLTLMLLSQSVAQHSAAQTLPADLPRDSAAKGTPRVNPLESVLGREVRTRVEEDVGRIIDLLVDRDGQVQAAVIEFGGFLGIGTRKIAVEWSALRFEAEAKKSLVIVDLTRDQLRMAPEYKPRAPAVVQGVSD